MQQKHTDGPWITKEYTNKNLGIDILRHPKSEPIANVTSHFLIDHKISQANATLIAAAPDLLEVLQKLASQFPEFDTDEELSGADTIEALGAMWPEIKNAIKKATEF